MYGFEACPLKKSDLHSLDFVVNRFCMKLFNASDMSIIRFCQTQFDIHLPTELLTKRTNKFERTRKF